MQIFLNFESFKMKTRHSKVSLTPPQSPKRPRRSARTKGGTNESSVTPQGPVKKVNAVQAASGVKPFVAKAQQSTSFAAVASGSSNDSFGMIQTGGTHPGTLAKAGSRKAKTPDLPNASAQVAPQAPQAPQPLLQDANLDFGSIGTFEKSEVKVQQAATNLDSKDYSPFKSSTGWCSNNSNDNEVTNKNFADEVKQMYQKITSGQKVTKVKKDFKSASGQGQVSPNFQETKRVLHREAFKPASHCSEVRGYEKVVPKQIYVRFSIF